MKHCYLLATGIIIRSDKRPQSKNLANLGRVLEFDEACVTPASGKPFRALGMQVLDSTLVIIGTWVETPEVKLEKKAA